MIKNIGKNLYTITYECIDGVVGTCTLSLSHLDFYLPHEILNEKIKKVWIVTPYSFDVYSNSTYFNDRDYYVQLIEFLKFQHQHLKNFSHQNNSCSIYTAFKKYHHADTKDYGGYTYHWELDTLDDLIIARLNLDNPLL